MDSREFAKTLHAIKCNSIASQFSQKTTKSEIVKAESEVDNLILIKNQNKIYSRSIVSNVSQDRVHKLEGVKMSEEAFMKAIQSEKLEVYSPESINKFNADISKAFDIGRAKQEDIEKAKKDISGLTKVQVTRKDGVVTTVYVKRGGDDKSQGKSKPSNEGETKKELPSVAERLKTWDDKTLRKHRDEIKRKISDIQDQLRRDQEDGTRTRESSKKAADEITKHEKNLKTVRDEIESRKKVESKDSGDKKSKSSIKGHNLTDEQKEKILGLASDSVSRSSLKYYLSEGYDFANEDGRLKITNKEGKVSYHGKSGSGSVLDKENDEKKETKEESKKPQIKNVKYGNAKNEFEDNEPEDISKFAKLLGGESKKDLVLIYDVNDLEEIWDLKDTGFDFKDKKDRSKEFDDMGVVTEYTMNGIKVVAHQNDSPLAIFLHKDGVSKLKEVIKQNKTNTKVEKAESSLPSPKEESNEHSKTYKELKQDAKDSKIDTTQKEFGKKIRRDHEAEDKEKGGSKSIKKADYTPAQEKKIAKVMKEFKAGDLKSSSGEVITDHKQAVAIAMSEAGLSNKK